MAETCTEIVRAADRERYIATLFAPDDMRDHLYALYAFDAEIARIPFLVSEPQIGEIRMQWWRDSIDAVYANDTVDHPVAQGLAGAIKQGRLPKAPLHNLIEARSRELYADPMPSLNELEGYLGETRSAVIQMAAQILLSGNGADLSNVSGYAGVAQGIADLVSKQSTALNLLPAGIEIPDLVAHAKKRLDEARKLLADVPLDARPAFLPLATVARKLDAKSSLSPLRVQWLIWRASRRFKI